MKIYLVYVTIPNKTFNRIGDLLDHQYEYTDSESGKNKIGLYAWSKDKEMLHDFLDLRKDCPCKYSVIKKNLDEEEFDEFKREYIEKNIIERPFNISVKENGKPKETVDIICTRNEYNQVHSYGDENLGFMLENMTWVDPTIFKGKLRDALEVIGYSSIYDCMIGGDPLLFTEEEIESRMDCANEWLSYNGAYDPNSVNIDTLQKNKFALYVKLFKALIIGDDEYEES